MTKLIVRDRDNQVVTEAVNDLYQRLLIKLGSKIVLGPVVPPISRIRGSYLREIYLKIDRDINLTKMRAFITKCINQTRSQKSFKTTNVTIDVDPV
jgi:primosomal protein N' (replication factor Y)